MPNPQSAIRNCQVVITAVGNPTGPPDTASEEMHMPCYATLNHDVTADRSDTQAVLEIINQDGRLLYALLLAEPVTVVDRAGPVASEAVVLIRNVNGPDDVPAAVTLDDSGELAPQNLPGGARVRISADGQTLFVGSLARRDELGAAGALRLTFLDDRFLLNRLPVRGALVHDANDPAHPVKFAPALRCRFNPGGLGNCVEASLAGAPWPVPLFLPGPDEAARMEAGAGEPTFWTPERALRYCWFLLAAFQFPEVCADVPRLDPRRILWPPESLQFDTGLMQCKLPDLDVQGRPASAVLEEICAIAGSIGWRLRYEGGQSQLAFCSRLRPQPDAPNAEPEQAGLSLPLQRAGAASDCKTVYDFQARTDYSVLAAAVVLDGAPYEIEAEFKYESADDDTLEPAWSPEDEDAFTDIIIGDGAYAVVDGSPMDGTGGRPLVYCLSREALSLARQRHPLPFHAFRLKSTGPGMETVLKGHAGLLAAFFEQALRLSRPILPHQLQRADGSSSQSPALPFPVRIQVSREGGAGPYHQVLAPAGLRVTDDGLIWLDGLTDDLARSDNLYEGSLISAPDLVVLKHIKINAVIRHDARLKAVSGLHQPGVDPNGIRGELDESLCVLGAGPQHYELRGRAFCEQHQVNSRPAAGNVVDGLPLPLNRVLTSDAAQIQAHASRSLNRMAGLARSQSWKLIGIRPEFQAGSFLDRVILLGPGGPLGSRAINAPIREVIWHFASPQFTEVRTMAGG
jgi:hypothetical protein